MAKTIDALANKVTVFDIRMDRDEQARDSIEQRVAYTERIARVTDPDCLLDKKQIGKLVEDAVQNEVSVFEKGQLVDGTLKSNVNPAFRSFASVHKKPSVLRLDSGRLNFEVKYGSATKIVTILIQSVTSSRHFHNLYLLRMLRRHTMKLPSRKSEPSEIMQARQRRRACFLSSSLLRSRPT